MQDYIQRALEHSVHRGLQSNPVVAILGPRQCGKSTLATRIISEIPGSLYLDLENPADLRKLDDPLTFFQANSGRLVCLDEIQRLPGIFSVIRSVVDRRGTNGQLLVLGSASVELLRQSSESLAGRITYLELAPFRYDEVSITGYRLFDYWSRGGFPRSLSAFDDDASLQWRNDFIRTFLERDISQLGIAVPSASLRRLWRMLAHDHGQLLNASKIGESLGVSHHTVRRYIDILEQTFLVRVLPPCERNVKKRLVKSPRVYIRDSGILHALLEVDDFNGLLGHSVYGPSWEGIVIENILTRLPRWRGSFYRTAAGAEIDLVLERGNKRIAVECKASSAPEVTRGFWNALEDLDISRAYVVAPVEESYLIRKGVTVLSLSGVLAALQD